MMYRFSAYKEQYGANLRLALPVVVAQLGQIVVQLADNVMVGQYGGEDPTPLAATSLGTTISFIILISAIGMAQGLTPLVGESYAQQKHRRSTRYLQNGILFYTLLGFAACGLHLLAIPLMHRLGQPADVVEMSIPYYTSLAFSMIPLMLFCSFKQFLEGIGNTTMQMIVVVVCNLINVLGNWILIYGHWGFDEMGAAGAGISTLVSRALMPVMLIACFCGRQKFRNYLQGFSLRSWSGTVVRKLLKIGWPIASQMFLEAFAFVGTSIMMGWLGKTAITANQIALVMANCAFMIVIAIGSATTIRVSHTYGARNFKDMVLASRASWHLVLVWNAIAAGVLIGLRYVLPTFFTHNAEVIEMTSTLLVMIAAFQLVDGLQNVSIGILRGMQDVRIIMPIAFLSYIVLNLPVGYLLGFTFEMGAPGLMFGFTVGLGIAAILLIWRVRRNFSIFTKNLPDERK